MNVATLYFAVWMVSDLGASGMLYGAASAFAAVIVAVSIPVLGAVSDARRHPAALRFILTSFLYQHTVGTIIGFVALYAVKAVGFERGAETTVFVVLTIPAILGRYIAGWLADWIGARRTLHLTLLSWIVLLIGLVFRGVPTAERPVLISLVPQEEARRYFSLMLLSA